MEFYPKKLILPCILLVITVIFTLIAVRVDVQPVGPNHTEVGLATLNTAVHEFFGEDHATMYRITDLLGKVSLVVAAAFGVFGLVQWIQRKNILKVDQEILALGVLFLIVIALWVGFNKLWIINYRPMIMPDETELESSFPSSHTMLVCAVFGAPLYLLKKYVPNRTLRVVLALFAVLVIGITIVFRLVCGAHWISDIIAGLLISATLLTAFRAFLPERKLKHASRA